MRVVDDHGFAAAGRPTQHHAQVELHEQFYDLSVADRVHGVDDVVRVVDHGGVARLSVVLFFADLVFDVLPLEILVEHEVDQVLVLDVGFELGLRVDLDTVPDFLADFDVERGAERPGKDLYQHAVHQLDGLADRQLLLAELLPDLDHLSAQHVVEHGQCAYVLPHHDVFVLELVYNYFEHLGHKSVDGKHIRG